MNLKKFTQSALFTAIFALSTPFFSPLAMADLRDDGKKAKESLEKGDYHTAFPLFKKIAEETGISSIQAVVAMMYQQGLGVKQDDQKAFYWFQKAAEQGYAEAQYELGIFYLVGKGVEKNIPLSVKWLEKSAAQENMDALMVLGKAYEVGKDEKKAKEYYGLACEKGSQEGCDEYRKLNEQGE